MSCKYNFQEDWERIGLSSRKFISSKHLQWDRLLFWPKWLHFAHGSSIRKCHNKWRFQRLVGFCCAVADHDGIYNYQFGVGFGHCNKLALHPMRMKSIYLKTTENDTYAIIKHEHSFRTNHKQANIRGKCAQRAQYTQIKIQVEWTKNKTIIKRLIHTNHLKINK